MTPLVSFVFFAACARYARPADMSPADSALLARVEAGYLERAREQAAFATACSKAEVATSVVSTKLAVIEMTDEGLAGPRRAFVVRDAGVITTIGTEGCGVRRLFQVVCGPREEYATVTALVAPCSVVAAGDAAELLTRGRAEQDDIERRAARAAHAPEKATK